MAAACALKSLSRENEQAGKFFQLLCLYVLKCFLFDMNLMFGSLSLKSDFYPEVVVEATG